jgi:isoquinoline 1-oxidoreductase subunit beta
MTNQDPLDPSRRSFLQLTSLAGAGLVLGFLDSPRLLAAAESAASATPVFTPNPFIQILPDGMIKLFSKNPEIGQGISTTLPMLIAEELGVDLSSVVVEQAPLNPAMGIQFIGGSQSVGSNHERMRRAGAVARDMLIAAAAARWSVPAAECTTEAGKVLHSKGNRSATFGELASEAAQLPVPDEKSVKLKDPSEFKVIGKWTPGVDNRKIVTGQPLFGIDFHLPGLLYAVYTKCPVFGGKPLSANLDDIKKLPGVKDAFILNGGGNPMGLRPGVAIVAENTWAALSARRQLEVKWDEGEGASQSTEGYAQQALELSKKPGATQVKSEGDFDSAYQGAAKKLEAAYSYPFIAHCCLEPLNCTVSVENGKMKVWTGTQAPREAAGTAGSQARIKSEDVSLQVMRSGGGFGRRINANYVAEAAAIAAKVNAPVKLTWDRTDDLHGGGYRASSFHFLKGGIDQEGKVLAWANHFITFGTNNTERPGEFADLPGDAFPARNVPNFKLERTILSTCLTMVSWRAPGVGAYTFVMQSFIDELAHLAGKDPLQFRLDFLKNSQFTAMLKTAAEKSDWSKSLPKGRGRGVSFGASSVQVAEVTVDKDGTLTVDKVTVVAGAGRIINPSGARAQIEGSVMDGLSATWLQALTLEKGRLVETNFHDYPLIRMNQAPVIDIHVNTGNGFSGMGEPYLPATAAAITNAIFAACGHRVRQLPIRKADLAWS